MSWRPARTHLHACLRLTYVCTTIVVGFAAYYVRAVLLLPACVLHFLIPLSDRSEAQTPRFAIRVYAPFTPFPTSCKRICCAAGAARLPGSFLPRVPHGPLLDVQTTGGPGSYPVVAQRRPRVPTFNTTRMAKEEAPPAAATPQEGWSLSDFKQPSFHLLLFVLLLSIITRTWESLSRLRRNVSHSSFQVSCRGCKVFKLSWQLQA